MPVKLGLLIGGFLTAFGLSQQMTPLQRAFTYALNSLLPNQELEPESLVVLYLKGAISLHTLIDRLKVHGYDATKAQEFLTVSKRVLSIADAIHLYRRGFIGEAELDKILHANGVPPGDKEKYLKATEFFPSPTDIIRFAVREVFTPEIVEKYRMYEDLPPEYLRLAEQAGIPSEIAKWYWYAHWDLPSLTMGFEMFHRKIITREELKTLMRTLDIMPGWRDKLIELSYYVPTRVDVRRMYEIGVIDRNKLKEYYEKMGYSPEDAELLTQWTEVEYVKEERKLTVRQILELYELGEFTKAEALKHLQELGYSKEAAEYKLKLQEHESLLREAKEHLNLLIEQYHAGTITYEQLHDEAMKLPFSPTTIKRIVTKAYRQKEIKQRLPSLSAVRRWFGLGIITEQEFLDYLRRLGYREIDAQRFLQELKVMEEAAQKGQGGGGG